MRKMETGQRLATLKQNIGFNTSYLEQVNNLQNSPKKDRIQLLEYQIPRPSQKPPSADISETESGIRWCQNDWKNLKYKQNKKKI